MRWLEKELKSIRLEFQPSLTNFLLIKFPDKEKYNAQNGENLLANHGTYVGGMSVYGLSNHLRISIGTEEENRTLIKKLKIFLEN